MKLLAKNPEQRYQHAESLKDDLLTCFLHWNSSKSIPAFSLEQDARPGLLVVPQKLYGRELEKRELEAALQRASVQNAPLEIAMIAGFSGTGKTSLIHELFISRGTRPYHFIEGKFDQFQREVPYLGLVHALNTLIAQMLVLNDKELDRQSQALSQALGSQRRILLEVAPMLEPILRTAPAVAELSPAEAERRQHQLMARLIGYFAKTKGALVLFLDDLQWADLASLKFLKYLATSSDLMQVLLLGAYRENESGHSLSHTLQTIHSAKPSSITLSLQPLTATEFAGLVADILQDDVARIHLLANILFEKTGGNPYFGLQFLQALHADGSIHFDVQSREWQWDFDEIAGKKVNSDLAEFLASKLQSLDPDCQRFLSLAAAWGPMVELQIVAPFLGRSEEDLAPILLDLQQLGLICSNGNVYHFSHDRIQEAAYALIPDSDRPVLHLKIARHLKLSSADTFTLVDQYNRTDNLLEGDERREAALLNRLAARKAKAAAAFPSAARYFGISRSQLSTQAWTLEHDLAFDLTLEETRCQLASGRWEEGQALLEHMDQQDLTLLERARVCRLWIELCVGQGQMQKALDFGFKGLLELGIQIPLHPSSDEVDREYVKFWKRLGQSEIENIVDLPLMTDPQKREIAALLAALIPPSFSIDFNLVALIWCHVVNIILEFGHCPTSVEAFGCFGLICQSLYDRYADGYRLGIVADRLVDKHGFAAERVHSYGTLKHLAFWTQPITLVLNYSEECIRAADEVGSNFLLCISIYHSLQFKLMSGAPLKELQVECERMLDYVQSRSIKTFSIPAMSFYRFAQSLASGLQDSTRSDVAFFDEKAFEAQVDACGITGLVCSHYIFKICSCFLRGHFAEAHAAGEKIRDKIWSLKSAPQLAYYCFYYALTLAACHDNSSEQERGILVSELKMLADKIGAWAKVNPQTFMNKYVLLEAELAQVEGRGQEVLALYEKAARLAREQGFIHEEALSYELAARHYQRQGLKDFALLFIRQAGVAYQRWGAYAKVMQFDRLYPDLKTLHGPLSYPTGVLADSSRIDLDSLLQSSRSIAGEFDLTQLVRTLLELVLVQAGADKAVLALTQGSQLMLIASALVDAQDILMDMPAIPLPAMSCPELLPPAVVQYVQRLGERVLIDSRTQATWFNLDETLNSHRPQSALCFPLKLQGQLVGLIYLENRTMPDVFTEDRIHILEVLAAQAAISVQHARLYQELHEQISRLHAILSSMPDAVEVMEPGGHLLLCNESYRQMFGHGAAGITMEELANQSLVKTWQGDPIPASELPQARAMRGEHVSRFGLRWHNPLTHKDIFLQSSATPVRDWQDRNIGIVTVTRDLTEWVELDHLKDEFLRVAAHELKTPVMIIKGYAQLLSRDLKDIQGPCQTHLEAIERGADRLSNLTNALLDISQAQMKRLKINFQSVNLTALIEESIRGIQVLAKNHNIRQVEMDSVTVLGSPVRLTQVMQNLLGNAIKYSPHGGDIEVAVKADGEWTTVSVKDYGVGIPASKQKHIFNMFFQAHVGTSHDYGGMGIGLHLTREIILLHHGEIELTSMEDQGTTVTFRLPVTHQP